VDFFLNSFFLAFDYTGYVLFPDYLMSVLTKEFGFGRVGDLVDFGDDTEFFFEIVESFDPLLIVLLIIERFIDLGDVFEVIHV
jgi:hypothetical protein